jgi:protein gp37
MAQSAIEWTDATWNPVTGCNKISQGCKNCYAERMAKRLRAMGQPRYANGFRVTLHHDMLEVPIHWRQPRMVFVNSMSDLFHEKVPIEFIQRIFDTMNFAYWHYYQILTKRAQRLEEISSHLEWSDHIWMGVSIENHDNAYRIEHLRRSAAKVKFLSLEPLLGPLPGLNLQGIHWVIVGGESGPGARPIEEEWVTDIRDQCLGAGVPFFFKQWGGVAKKKNGRNLQGRTWDELPVKLDVLELV